MSDKRVLSNRRITVWMGPANGIADYEAPTKAELDAMLNVSGAIKWDGFDFNLQASDQEDDRSLTDEAGAQERSYDQFGGVIPFYEPAPTDAGSILRLTKNLVDAIGTELAVCVRTILFNSTGAAVGDELNAYKVVVDAPSRKRGPSKRYYTRNFRSRDALGVNCIVPAVTPTAVTVSPASPTVNVGKPTFLKSTYQGRNVTVGAKYISSDPTKLIALNNGILIGVAAGTASLSVSYPGSAAPTPISITVAAA